jgi:hypothetical protein
VRATGHELTHRKRSHGRRSRSGEGHRLAARQATGSGGELVRATGHAQAHQQHSHGRLSRSGEGHGLPVLRRARHRATLRPTSSAATSSHWLRWRSDAPAVQQRHQVNRVGPRARTGEGHSQAHQPQHQRHGRWSRSVPHTMIWRGTRATLRPTVTSSAATVCGRGRVTPPGQPGHRLAPCRGTRSGHDLAHRVNRPRSGHQQCNHGRWSWSGESYRLALVSSCGRQRRRHQVNRAGPRARTGEAHRLAPRQAAGSGGDLARATGCQWRHHQVNRAGPRARTGESHAQAHQHQHHGRWSRSGDNTRSTGPCSGPPAPQPRHRYIKRRGQRNINRV